MGRRRRRRRRRSGPGKGDVLLLAETFLSELAEASGDKKK